MATRRPEPRCPYMSQAIQLGTTKGIRRIETVVRRFVTKAPLTRSRCATVPISQALPRRIAEHVMGEDMLWGLVLGGLFESCAG